MTSLAFACAALHTQVSSLSTHRKCSCSCRQALHQRPLHTAIPAPILLLLLAILLSNLLVARPQLLAVQDHPVRQNRRSSAKFLLLVLPRSYLALGFLCSGILQAARNRSTGL
ncbi:hypothetical protein EJ03DRAFT_34818 [Teratosphaeria nubilosa]|uniref:Uncharacterized protein n=1 Tax=Teratosphaeria nubilosa TaxID=161662 RepID=A0A6G1KVG8_9PEZI|nr:hypothetical protein EJ03DRAFT_34818 [Teratosphaeria nubilosa]